MALLFLPPMVCHVYLTPGRLLLENYMAEQLIMDVQHHYYTGQPSRTASLVSLSLISLMVVIESHILYVTGRAKINHLVA